MNIKQYPVKYLSLAKLLELPFNRKKNEKQIKDLMKAIVANGVARKPFIVLTKAITGRLEYYIIDGQHLIEACKRLGIDKIECMHVESESISWMVNMMAGLNNINQKWVLMDYVDAYCGTGNENFYKLKNHSIVNGLSVAVSASILSGTNVAGKAINPIKDDTFKVSNVEHDIITQNLLEVSSLVNTNSAKFHKAYLSFYRSLNGKYNHKRLMDKIKDNKNFKNIPHDSGYIYDLIHKTYTGK